MSHAQDTAKLTTFLDSLESALGNGSPEDVLAFLRVLRMNGLDDEPNAQLIAAFSEGPQPAHFDQVRLWIKTQRQALEPADDDGGLFDDFDAFDDADFISVADDLDEFSDFEDMDDALLELDSKAELIDDFDDLEDLDSFDDFDDFDNFDDLESLSMDADDSDGGSQEFLIDEGPESQDAVPAMDIDAVGADHTPAPPSATTEQHEGDNDWADPPSQDQVPAASPFAGDREATRQFDPSQLQALSSASSPRTSASEESTQEAPDEPTSGPPPTLKATAAPLDPASSPTADDASSPSLEIDQEVDFDFAMGASISTPWEDYGIKSPDSESRATSETEDDAGDSSATVAPRPTSDAEDVHARPTRREFQAPKTPLPEKSEAPAAQDDPPGTAEVENPIQFDEFSALGDDDGAQSSSGSQDLSAEASPTADGDDFDFAPPPLSNDDAAPQGPAAHDDFDLDIGLAEATPSPADDGPSAKQTAESTPAPSASEPAADSDAFDFDFADDDESFSQHSNEPTAARDDGSETGDDDFDFDFAPEPAADHSFDSSTDDDDDDFDFDFAPEPAADHSFDSSTDDDDDDFDFDFAPEPAADDSFDVSADDDDDDDDDDDFDFDFAPESTGGNDDDPYGEEMGYANPPDDAPFFPTPIGDDSADSDSDDQSSSPFPVSPSVAAEPTSPRNEEPTAKTPRPPEESKEPKEPVRPRSETPFVSPSAAESFQTSLATPAKGSTPLPQEPSSPSQAPLPEDELLALGEELSASATASDGAVQPVPDESSPGHSYRGEPLVRELGDEPTPARAPEENVPLGSFSSRQSSSEDTNPFAQQAPTGVRNAPMEASSFVLEEVQESVAETSDPSQTIAAAVAQAKEHYANGEFQDATDLVDAILEHDSDHAEARELQGLLEGELERLQIDRLGSLMRTPTLAVSMGDIAGLDLDNRAGFLLSQIDGMLTFEDILDMSAMPRLETLQLLAKLYEEEIIEVD